MRKQVMDAEMAVHARSREVQSLLDQRYNDGVASEAALARINRPMEGEETAQLCAMYDRLEVAVRGERHEEALARAVAVPLHVMEEELVV